MTVRKPIFLTGGGIFAQLANGAIINAGGVHNDTGTFTVNGNGLLYDSGASTSGGVGITLQKVYDRSNPASIHLATGKDFTIYDDTDSTIFFRIDAETGKVTITGDLEVLGSSSTINTTITDADHWIISPASGFTPALRIEPDATAAPYMVDLVNIRKAFGGPPVFRIDKDGNIFISELINGLNLVQFYADFVDHVTTSPAPKHLAAEISVAGPFINIGAPSNVEQALVALDALGGGGGGGGNDDSGLFFTDVAPAGPGLVGDKLYVAGTVPVNRVITQATTDTDDVVVTLFVEGDRAFYSPTVTITTVPPQVGGPVVATLVEDPFDRRAFVATAPLTIATNTALTATASTGAQATMLIERGAPGPALSSLTIGPYPGTQTAVKQGDTLTVTGTVDNAAVSAKLLAGGACATVTALTLGAINSGGPGLRTVSGSFVVGAATGVQLVQADATNAFGTTGPPLPSSNSVLLDQVYPSIGPRAITYPPGQEALKGSESATVDATISDFDTVLYTAVNLTVASPTVYGTKTATRTGGAYSVGVNNYTITATRAANAAVTTASSAISIANVAPTAEISIAGNPPRLRTSPAGLDYTITITADQLLLGPPSLSASSGTWLGTWVGAGTTWSRVLRVTDADPRGAQLFSSLAITGLAGLVGTTITAGATYVVGGFLTRTITFPAFARYAPIGTSVVDFLKVAAAYTDSSPLTRYGDTGDYFQGFTIVDSGGNFDPTGDHLFISDAAFAGANTSGTLQLDIEEVA